MNIAVSILALALQVTPPPAPPVLASPAPSPSATVSPPASPSPASSPGNLTVTPATLNLHPSQTHALTVTNATGTITAQTDTPAISVSVDQTARTVAVSASPQAGRAIVTVSDSSGASVQVPVRVAFDAGVVPGTVTLRVTGNPVDTTWLQGQVQKAIAKSIQLQPGASLRTPSFTLPALFTPGSVAAIPVAITITGGNQYFDVVNAPLTVDLQNVDSSAFAPPFLFYDDDPERITGDGILYQNQVTAANPTRLYYYHENTNNQHQLFVVFSAPSGPATVQLIDASAGPNIDVMSVGHAVTRDFLMQKPRNEGLVVDITPQTPFVADQFLLNRLDGAAGTIGIRLLTGGPVTVTVLTAPPASASDPPASSQVAALLGQPKLPGDGHHRTGVFNITTYGQETIAYTAGGPDAMTQYGAQSPPSADPASTGHDYGEYGVLRTLTFDVNNPSGQTATAYLYERPMGGVVRSSFLVDGTLYQVGCARVPQRYLIGAPFAIPSGQTRITVQTMTDGGSAYPLEIGLTATPPLSTTPPISAPDGCFPKPSAPAATPAASPAPSPSPPSGSPLFVPQGESTARPQ